MSTTDFLVIAVIAALLVLAVRSIVRSRADGCSDCGSRGSCSAHVTGAPCPAAKDMLSHVEDRLNKL